MSSSEMRRRYLEKLTYHRVWLSPLQQVKSHQNLIIFDWDDTLLCTGMLNPNDEHQMEGILAKFKKEIMSIQRHTLSVLKKANKVGKALIITNARTGWVEFSSSIMLPKVYRYILQHVAVLSARDLYENEYPYETYLWKEHTFMSLWQKECSGLVPTALTNLVVVGDSQFEMDAGLNFQKQAKLCLVKLVKLKE